MSRDSFRDPATIHGRNAITQYPDEATVYAAPVAVRIARAQEHIAAGHPVVWHGGDPNDEITGDPWTDAQAVFAVFAAIDDKAAEAAGEGGQ